MSIRSEIESRLLSWAASQSPAIPVSLEGVAFTKPTVGNYLEVFFLGSATTNPTIDGTRVRNIGTVQVNCCVPDGTGSKNVEALAQSIVNLFPVVPKSIMTTVSVEQTPQTSQALINNTFRFIPVRIKYRQES